MTWIDKLEKRFGNLAIQNLALYIIFGQVIVWLLIYVNVFPIDTFHLIPYRVLQGEIWRLVSFVFVPELGWSPFLLLIGWYVFWFIAKELEAQWGTFRFTLYIWLGAVFTVLISFFVPVYPYSFFYIELTVLLAFATLYPDFEFRLYFILPVKVKWIALLSLAFPLMDLFKGPWPIRFVILASLGNYFLFFGKDLYQMFYLKKRRMDHQKKVQETAEEAFHTCSNCGATDKSNPEREFRYREGKGICSVCLEKEVSSKSI